MTHLDGSFMNPSAFFVSNASGISSVAFAWHILVVGRMNTGVSYFSESLYASGIIANASSGEEGSNTGTFEKEAKVRVSCSVCEDIGPGSSATRMTIPPRSPTYSSDISGSEATLSPTCFIVTSVRAPE